MTVGHEETPVGAAPPQPSPAGGEPAARAEPAAGTESEKAPLGVLELMYGTLFSPVATFREVATRPHLGRAVAVLAVVAVVNAAVGAISGGREFAAGMAGAGMPVPGGSFGPVAFLFGLVGPFLFWYLQTAIFYLTGVLLGGRGAIVPLMAGLAVAAMPQVFSAPAVLVSTAVHRGVGVWFSVALGMWVAVLYCLAVREALHFSTGRAIATLVLPLLAIVVLVVGAAIAFALAFLPLIQQFVPGSVPPIP